MVSTFHMSLVQLSTAQGDDWEAVGHALSHSWSNFGARYGVWIFAALMAFVVLRGLMRRDRFRASEALGDDDREALRDRVAAAESKTSGEIVVVVVEASDDHPDAPWKAATATWLVGTLLLGGWAEWLEAAAGPVAFIALQIMLAVLGYVLALSLHDFRRSFIREARATGVAEEQALQELQRLDLTSKDERSAVLLFVSVFEQRVVILADTRAHEAAGENAWVEADAAVLRALRGNASATGFLRTGLENGIDAVGSVLATALPATGASTNDFDDSIEVRQR